MVSGTMRFLSRLLWMGAAVAIILLAVMNRAPVPVYVPFADEPFAVPAFFLIFLGIFIGLLAAFFVTSHLRLKGFVARRQSERRAAQLEVQMSAMADDKVASDKASAEKAIATGQDI